MNIYKTLFLLLICLSLPTFAADYFISGQYEVEDRSDGDDDSNDSVVGLKAIFQTDGEDKIPELVVMINPLAYGAKDKIEIRLDVSRYDGVCSDPFYTLGTPCMNAGHVWTPINGDYYLHTKDRVIDLEVGFDGIPDSGDEFVIYRNSEEMFVDCDKTILINTLTNVKECDGNPRVLTIIDSGLKWGNGNFGPGAIECSNSSNCAGTTSETNSQFDLNQFLDLRNKNESTRIGSNGATNTILKSIDTGWSLERKHWFEAYLQGQGQEGLTGNANIDLDDCDPRVPLVAVSSTQCYQALSDWFRNKSGADGISQAFVAGNNNLMNDPNISSPDFAIDQINGGTIASPTFQGPEWDPKNVGTMHLVHQYFSELGNPIGAGHSQVRLLRLSCNFFDCGEIGDSGGAVAGNLAVGDACNDGEQCQSGFCDFTAGTPGICANAPQLHTQSVVVCTPNYMYPTVDPGCSPQYPICTNGVECSTGGIGAPCMTGTDCVSLNCDYGNNVCL